jgi:hypothetical protein
MRASRTSAEEQLITVYVTNAVRTSGAPGPGQKSLPPEEASRLVSNKLAVYGDQPPRSFLGGGTGLRT